MPPSFLDRETGLLHFWSCRFWHFLLPSASCFFRDPEARWPVRAPRVAPRPVDREPPNFGRSSWTRPRGPRACSCPRGVELRDISGYRDIGSFQLDPVSTRCDDWGTVLGACVSINVARLGHGGRLAVVRRLLEREVARIRPSCYLLYKPDLLLVRINALEANFPRGRALVFLFSAWPRRNGFPFFQHVAETAARSKARRPP